MTKEITNENFQREVLESSVPVLLDFWASWCPPCRRLSPVLDQVSGEGKGRFEVAKVNVGDYPELANRFHVSALPTLLIFQGGQVVNTLVGFKDRATLLRALGQEA